ncbi:MAG TPA: ABC transporter substrate-binding protein [Burkholderiaceae bacterium]|nr:ABC transporter substrate-binding protein [Burkholderiaceae bacterium]
MTHSRLAFLKALLVSLGTLMLPLAAQASGTALPVEVPRGTKLVIADDARGTEFLLKLSGEQEKLAADVSYASFSSGPLRMEAIRSGSAQVGIVGDVPPILAHYAGVDLRIVGVVANTGPSLVITTSAGSGIRTIQDLKGRRVAINEGTAQHAVVLRALRQVGLSASDIVPVKLGVSEFVDALRANQIDAAVLKQPDRARYLATAAAQGAVELKTEPGTNPGYLYAYASREALEDPAQSAAIRDFIIHWYRAQQWKNGNHDTWLQAYLIQNQRLKPDDAQKVIESHGEVVFPGLGDAVLATQQQTIDLLQGAGVFPGKTLDARDEFDLRFATLSAETGHVH